MGYILKGNEVQSGAGGKNRSAAKAYNP